MNFSISSANMTILISNIFIFLLFLIFRNQKVRFNLGLPILIGFIFLICLRMMFPIEILYLIFDYPYKHYTFKYFEV